MEGSQCLGLCIVFFLVPTALAITFIRNIRLDGMRCKKCSKQKKKRESGSYTNFNIVSRHSSVCWLTTAQKKILFYKRISRLSRRIHRVFHRLLYSGLNLRSVRTTHTMKLIDFSLWLLLFNLNDTRPFRPQQTLKASSSLKKQNSRDELAGCE